jgi:very-short-patch-repair endonuclease
MADINSIFNFLKEFNELSNPVSTDINNQKWSMNIADVPEIDEISSIFSGHEIDVRDDMEYLVVERPQILSCPEPHERLLEWIVGDWKNLKVDEIEVREYITRERLDEEGNLVFVDELFDIDIELVEIFDNWISLRNSWLEAEVPKKKGLDFYNRLFELYSQLKKESESVELILGDGNIRWFTEDRIIDHPVLLQKVKLHFDAQVPSFKIYAEEEKTELYSPMLRVIESVNQKMLSEIITEIDNGNYGIADIDNTRGLYKRIVNVIDTEGSYVDEAAPINDKAVIYSSPVLFLRKRTLGYSGFIENVIKDVEENTDNDLPGFFNTMTGVYKDEAQGEIIEESWNHNGIDEDVLLTLPANSEQLKIIKYLDKYGAVLVQGPPGTGKTHTIANLIGHLLSQGSSVLVTSQTEKALSVLKEKVFKDQNDSAQNLQSLCINLLSGISQKKEMDGVINEIASKSSSMDLHSSFEKIGKLENERKNLIEQAKMMGDELVRVRSLEYKDLIYDNHTIVPLDAAKFLSDGTGIYDYIRGKSNDDEIAFPLSHEELVFLYFSNERVNCEEESLLKKSYPAKEQIISSSEFKSITAKINELKNAVFQKSEYEEIDIVMEMNDVNRYHEKSSNLVSRIDAFKPLEKGIVNLTISDPAYSKLWDEVIENIECIESDYESYRKMTFKDDFNYDDSTVTSHNLEVINNIIDSGKEKPIGMFAKREWKNLSKVISINGKNVGSKEDFVKVKEVFSYKIQKNETQNQLRKLLFDVVDEDKLQFDDLENKIRRYKSQVLDSLNWYKEECEDYLVNFKESVGSNQVKLFGNVSSINDVDCALDCVQSADRFLQWLINKDELLSLEAKINDYKDVLNEYCDGNHMIRSLLQAVESMNKAGYSGCLEKLNTLIDKREVVETREALLSRIRAIAPELAIEIENREGVHSGKIIPENFDDAWKYFQLKNQIKKLDEVDPAKIQADIEQTNDLLLKNSRTLAYEKAWYEKINNQTDKQNQALQGWSSTIKQIGKGTGKNAPRLKVKARELMPQCQTAIPVWIMPLNRVVENFDPRNNEFDVIIIDEASQANILALAALYLGNKVIIVGDDEQVSPDTVGLKTEEINALVAQHLEHIPLNHLYNGSTSLYDMAKQAGFKPLMLTEHFRCLPEIIGFSNMLSYDGRIKPLRDSSNTSVYPPIVEYRVAGASRDKKKVNEVEAEHIVSLVQAFLDIEEYKEQTIGVISMLGHDHSAYIEKRLQIEIDPVVLEERKIQCGTPPQFQGDERDIILMSLVDGPNENGGPLRLVSEDGYNDKNRKRYNVAASRAKNQLWVVHSLNPEVDLKPADIRLKLIKYAMNPNIDHEVALSHSESPFESEVMKYLLDKRYKVLPQFKVGAYRIDMVIQCGDKKIALECDGERFHTIDNLDSDLTRQAILERLGWRFIRIRGSVYYRNKEETMADVLESLTMHEIYPLFEDEEEDGYVNDDLINRVKIKARSYRNEDVGELQEEEEVTDIEESEVALVDNESRVENSRGSVEIEEPKKQIEFNLTKENEENNKVEEVKAEEYDKKIGVDIQETSSDKEIEAESIKSEAEGMIITESKKVQNTVHDKAKPGFDFRNNAVKNERKPAKKIVVKKDEEKTDKKVKVKKEKEKLKGTELKKPKFDFRGK